MVAYWHFVIMIVGGIETMWLGSLHTRNLIKWEPIWCLAVVEFGGSVGSGGCLTSSL